MEILELILFAANFPKQEKTTALQKTNIKINLLKTLIRLTQDLKIIDSKKYIQLEQELQEVGKMVGGWLRSIN